MEQNLLYFMDLSSENKGKEYISVSHHEGDDYVSLRIEYTGVDLTADQIETLIRSLQDAKRYLYSK